MMTVQPSRLTSPSKISNGLGKSKYFLESTDPRVTDPRRSVGGPPEDSFCKKGFSTLARNLFSPTGGLLESRETATIGGWRVGRNPPSVPSSICLIGEPAPRAEFTGVYIPFHRAMG